MADDVKPVRLRLSRAKGFDLQALSIATNGLAAINVARPTIWGNPFVVGQPSGHSFRDGGDPTPLVASMTAEQAVEFFETVCRGCLMPEMHPAGHQWIKLFRKRLGCHPMEWVRDLHGHNLACWCELVNRHGDYVSCHADVLLRLANPPRPTERSGDAHPTLEPEGGRADGEGLGRETAGAGGGA